MEAIRYENSEIDERIIRAVTEIGYEEMTPIQQSAIPALLEGRDIFGQAQTGTGKTAAFGIPLVQMIDPADILRSGAAHLLPGWPVLWSGKARLPARAHLPGRSSEKTYVKA